MSTLHKEMFYSDYEAIKGCIHYKNSTINNCHVKIWISNFRGRPNIALSGHSGYAAIAGKTLDIQLPPARSPGAGWQLSLFNGAKPAPSYPMNSYQLASFADLTCLAPVDMAVCPIPLLSSLCFHPRPMADVTFSSTIPGQEDWEVLNYTPSKYS